MLGYRKRKYRSVFREELQIVMGKQINPFSTLQATIPNVYWQHSAFTGRKRMVSDVMDMDNEAV